MTEHVLKACQDGIAAWQQAFNMGNAAGCADSYVQNATMVAKPFGTFTGHKQIREFWQNIIDQGYTDVIYEDTTWHAEDNDSYTLTSNWTMNKAHGVVHKEIWKIQPDGKARLIYDEFEVKGER